MRTELKNIGSEERHTFTALIGRQGTKSGWQGELIDTILLHDVRLKENGEKITGHIWFTFGTNFENSECEEGDTIEFSGRVRSYEKGWKGKKAEENGYYNTYSDWKLERPTKIKVIQKVSPEEIEAREKKKEQEIIEKEKRAEEVRREREILLAENEKIKKFYDENLKNIEDCKLKRREFANKYKVSGRERDRLRTKIQKFKTTNRQIVIDSDFNFSVFKEKLNNLPKNEWIWHEITDEIITKIKPLEIAQ